MCLWLGAAPLVLASQSESRRELLSAAGIPHEVVPADIDERLIERRMGAATPPEVAQLLAREKSLAVSLRCPGTFVVGADQTLSAGEHRFSKPGSRAQARQQLMMLRNRAHELHSALAIARDGAVLFAHIEVARLFMRNFSEAFLDAYLDRIGSAATVSVGAYQLEKLGIQLFERVEGDHFVILGLPLLSLLRFLRGAGLLLE
jgi:septum formation protein